MGLQLIGEEGASGYKEVEGVEDSEPQMGSVVMSWDYCCRIVLA